MVMKKSKSQTKQNPPRRTSEIKIRCTPDFKKFVKDLGSKHNLPMTRIVELGFKKFDEKYQCDKPKSSKVIHQADPKLIYEISKIGNNINQLARAINQGEEFSLEALTILKSIEQNLEDLKNGDF